MAINDPYAPGSARQPRLRILCNGQPVGGPLEFEVTNNNYYQADTFTARFSLNTDPDFGVAWWGLASTQQILLDMQASIDAGNTWTSLLIGQVDHMHVEMHNGVVNVDGRDLTAYFIDAKTQETFLNQTSSQVVQTLAARHGLTADVTPTTTLVGRYYGDDHERLTLNAFTHTTTEWNLLCSLAQHEQFDIYVTGTTVHFHPTTPPDSNPWVVQWDASLPWMNGVTLDLERSMTMAKNVVVVVRSWNSREGRGFSKFSPSGARINSITSGKSQQFTYIIPDLTEAAAQAMANKLREDITRHERLATIKAPADLVVTPRHMLQVIGTNSSWDQTYYVDWVRRSLSFDGGFPMTIHAKNHSPQTSVVTS